MKRIYLDYAATTPVDPRIKKAMQPYFTEKFGNTMSLHSFGQEAKVALEESREVVADLIGAKPSEIIFTSSATESNNLALKGVAFVPMSRRNETSRIHDFSKAEIGTNKNKGKPSFAKASEEQGHIIISAIEHPCIIESAKWLEKQGFEITRIKVDKYGLVNPDDIEKAIKKDTILVSIIYASNEIGTIQPIEKIGQILKTINYKLKTKIYFHTDAAQSFGKIPIDVNKMNIDLLTASSHKMYGPKGAACLFIREGIKIEPLLHGGGHESGLRSSTINLPAIVGFAKACEIAKKQIGRESTRLVKLRDKLIKEVLKIKGAHLNGPPSHKATEGQSHLKNRLPNNANFSFDFIEGESLVIQLDLHGIAASTGSACSSIKLEPSHVLLAIGLKPQEAHGSLRISLGRWTTEKEIDYLLKVLPKIVKQLRSISPFKR